ncbi:hypothetical protein KKD88_03210, partial [Patescibacteria group bacterium]|nr:hypothetical protein [Patescibacteria group bacterium]MBU1630058.1 hypothetical protein [Patescibacteria group bacterium]
VLPLAQPPKTNANISDSHMSMNSSPMHALKIALGTIRAASRLIVKVLSRQLPKQGSPVRKPPRHSRYASRPKRARFSYDSKGDGALIAQTIRNGNWTDKDLTAFCGRIYVRQYNRPGMWITITK